MSSKYIRASQERRSQSESHQRGDRGNVHTINKILSTRTQKREAEMQDQTTTTTSSPHSSSDRSSSSAPHTDYPKEGMDSDDDIGRVPEFRLDQGGPSTSGREPAAAGTLLEPAQSAAAAQAASRRRGRSPADKEHRRLKRLLRNRVSAQQARERKKAYMGELETKVKDLENRNSELEERLSTLQNENQMLRQILKNTTGNKRGPGSGAGAGGS